MSTYPGPWIQAPDYERADDEVFIPETIPVDIHVEMPVETHGAFTPYDAPDFQEAIMNSHLGAREVIVDATAAFEGWMLVRANYASTSVPVAYTRWGDVYRAWRVSTISAENQGVRYWAPTAPLVGITPPPDAIGWEWLDGSPAGDSAKSQVVSLHADLEVARSPVDDTIAGPLGTPFVTAVEASAGRFLSDDAELGVTDADQLQEWFGPTPWLPDLSDASANGDLITLVGGPHYPLDASENLHFPQDLTPFLDDKGRVVLSSYVTFDTLHPEAGATPIVPAVLTDPGEPQVQYGHSLFWHPVWTFRPPIFRWLYAEPQITSAPPLRHTQRDDNHGPSPRNRPTRSRQAGHRNTGYL